MECFLAFLFIVVIATAMVVMAAFRQSGADRVNQTFQNLARRFQGTCTPSGWFSRPSIRFRYGATHALVTTSGKRRGEQFTQTLISWPDHDTYAEIFPAVRSPFESSYGMPAELRLGNAEFASRYIVRTGDRPQVEKFLSEGVQWQIDKLRKLLADDDVHITLNHGRLQIRKHTAIRRFDQLEEFVTLCLELYDQGMLTRSAGIDFIEDAAGPVGEAVCQICSEDITTDMVFCRRCKTPHHVECWEYLGHCAVYGCGEKRCVAPKVAK